MKAGIVHRRQAEGVGVRVQGGGLGRLRGGCRAPVLQGATTAAGGRQEGHAVPEKVVVVTQRRQQRLGLGADARVFAGGGRAALAVAERVEVGGGRGAGGDVGEGEAAAVAGGRVAASDLRRCQRRRDVWGQRSAGALAVHWGRIELGNRLDTPGKEEREEVSQVKSTPWKKKLLW